MANIQARAEPLNGELLWLQQQQRHRSYSIFNGQGSDRPIRARRCDKKLWDHIKELENQQINHHVFHHITEAGFAGLFQTGFHKLDHALITALVERWRPETHTFHFPIGEATITLQDVQVLFGLPIDGPPVTGFWDSLQTHEWMCVCEEQLGFMPEETEIESGKIKIATLLEQLEEELEDNEEAYQQRARIYILALMGGQLFVDSGQHDVSLNYLNNIQDLSRAGRKSWGSAVLAHLYRNLCSASENINQKGIQGCLVLMQYWAWDRMPHLAPTLRNPEVYNYEECYAARWNTTMSFLDTVSHVAVTFRAGYTALKPGQFLWTPYDGIIHLLPEDCRSDRQIWSYSGWLVFWSIVEPHVPHRVARQFGFVQSIPGNSLLLSPQQHTQIHNITRTGRSNTDWVNVHSQYINVWNNRHNLVFNGQPGVSTTGNYMQWYWERTVLSITNPGRAGPPNRYPEWGATQHFYEEGIREIHNRAEQGIQRYPDSNRYLQDFISIPQQMMDYGSYQDRMNYGSQNYQFPSSQNYHPAPPNTGNYHQGSSNPVNTGNYHQGSYYPGSSNPVNTGNYHQGSFYDTPHPVFSTPTNPAYHQGGPSSFVDNLFNVDNNAFAPDYHMDARNQRFAQFSPVQMQNLSDVGTSRNPSSSRHPRDINLGDDDDDDDDDDADDNDDNDDDDDQPPGFENYLVGRARRQIRRPRCGTGGHR